jgi:hypothetical protein
MKLVEIEESAKIYPGEYIFHKPTSAIVLVGAFNRKKDLIRAFNNGKLMEDVIMNFKKIELDRKEMKEYKKPGCGKCKGGKG